VLEQLNREAPDGIDVYFDNVGGETLEAAPLGIARPRPGSSPVAASPVTTRERPPRPSNLFNITTKRLTMKGLIVSDSLDRRAEFEQEVGGYFKAGKLSRQGNGGARNRSGSGRFIGLFQGQNIGKMVVEVA